MRHYKITISFSSRTSESLATEPTLNPHFVIIILVFYTVPALINLTPWLFSFNFLFSTKRRPGEHSAVGLEHQWKPFIATINWRRIATGVLTYIAMLEIHFLLLPVTDK